MAAWMLAGMASAFGGGAAEVDPAIADALQTARSLRGHRLDQEAVVVPESSWSAPVQSPRAGIERVSGVSAAKAWGAIRIDAPIEAVWLVLNDESRLAGELPVSHAAVLSGDVHGNRRVFEYLPLPIVSDRWWVVDVRHNAPLYTASSGRVWEMAWSDAPSEELKGTDWESLAADGVEAAWTRGSWLLVDLGEHGTWVEYTTWSDPGGSLPAGPATSFASGAVKSTLEAVAELADRARSESRAGFTRPDGSDLASVR